MSLRNKEIILEKPISTKDEDKFKITSYAESLNDACDAGADFIAINGSHGTGKSSIINLFKENISKKRFLYFFKTENKKAKFITINFLNIGADLLKEKDNEETITEKYNRFFTNQVIGDILNSPINQEKLFYYDSVSYGVQWEKFKKWQKLVIDKLMLILISVSITLKGLTLMFKELFSLLPINIDVISFTCFFLFVLLSVMYGFNIFKPEDLKKSPVLNIDKCRNNLIKVILTSLNRKSTIYIIIDDLDRNKTNQKIQDGIISLLYNEYLPLSGKYKNISIKFIFMIDLKQKLESESELDYNKIFDYILPIANNQPNIMKRYIKDSITSSFSDKNFQLKEEQFIIAEILRSYQTIRDFKHYLNRVIAKYNYLKSREDVEFDNYDQLFIMSILTEKNNDSFICELIQNLLNNSVIDFNTFSNKNETQYKTENNDIAKIIRNCIDKEIIDKNYYLCVYNFIDKDDIYFPNEIILEDMLIKCSNINELDLEKFYLELDKISINNRFNFVHKNIYLTQPSIEFKSIFYKNEYFFKYLLENNFDKLTLKNIYKFKFTYYVLDVIKKLSNNFGELSNIILFDINSKHAELIKQYGMYPLDMENETFLAIEKNYIDLILVFLENAKEKALLFDFMDLYNYLRLDDKLYDLIFNHYRENNIGIGYILYSNNRLPFDSFKQVLSNDFFDNLLNINIDTKFIDNIGKKLFNDSDDIEIVFSILKYNSWVIQSLEIFEKLNSFDEISLEKLIFILEKFNYNSNLDKFITKYISDPDIFNIINKNEYNLSTKIIKIFGDSNLDKIFSSHILDFFKKNKFFKPYIHSNGNQFKIYKYNSKLNNKKQYKIDLLNIFYKNNNSSYFKINFDEKNKAFICKNLELSKIEQLEKNMWKIEYLYKHMDTNYIKKIVDDLKKIGLSDKFAINMINDKHFKNADVLLYIKEQVDNNTINLSSSQKGLLTRKINKL